MRYLRLGTTGMYVSELGLGTLPFGREVDAQEAHALIAKYLDAGGNFLDTADIYGRGASEEVVGHAVAARRDDIVIATKGRFRTGPHPNQAGSSRRHLRLAVEASLRRLGTDRIDLYQLHGWDPDTSVADTLATLNDLVREGKILYVGLSNFTGWQAAHTLSTAWRHQWEPPAVLQLGYSLLSRDAERELLPLALHAGLAVMAWSPLGAGVLSGKYRHDDAPPPRGDISARTLSIAAAVREVATRLGRSPLQVALRWLLDRDDPVVPVFGVRSHEQLDDDLGAVGWELDADSRAALEVIGTIEPGYPHDIDEDHPRATHLLRPPWRE